MLDKPSYRIPSMREIESAQHNGFDVVSTFAGCGGSSTGYRMAGFRILWANEFIDEARETYAANARRATIIDRRDIRDVSADDILTAISLKPGELDLLDGSPPCSSFSTVGKRERDWGKVKTYSDKAQRTDDLFFEFTRILEGLQPKAFVAENVSGLVKGTAKGYFLEILQALKACGYKVSAKLLDAQYLGVPQARQRLIFVGVRKDLGLDPVHPSPLPYRYSMLDAMPHLRSGNLIIGDPNHKRKPGHNFERGKKVSLEKPCMTITTNGISGGASHNLEIFHAGEAKVEKRPLTISELRRICSFPDDFILTGSYEQQWERLGRAVPPLMMKSIAEAVRDNILKKARR